MRQLSPIVHVSVQLLPYVDGVEHASQASVVALRAKGSAQTVGVQVLLMATLKRNPSWHISWPVPVYPESHMPFSGMGPQGVQLEP